MAQLAAPVAASLIAGVLGLTTSLLTKPKAPKPVVQQPQATPRSNSVIANALAARRGEGENKRTGTMGVESTTTAKTDKMGG